MPAQPPSEKALADFIQLRRRVFYPKTDLELAPAELGENLAGKEAAGRELLEPARAAIETAAGRRVARIECLPGGTFHLLFRAVLEDGRSVFLRAEFIHRHRPGFELLIEQRLAPLLAAKEVPNPEILGTDFSRSVFPLDYQVIAEAGGTRLTEIENPETQFVPDAVLEDFARVLARVHSIEAAGAGLLDPAANKPRGVLSGWAEYVRLNLEQHLVLCESILAITPAERREIEDAFDDLDELNTRPIRLLHGDPGHHNVFVERGRVSAVLDWEDAVAGDPIFDLAYWGTFTRDYLREPLLRGYRETAPLGPDFERLYWLYYLRIAISKTVHRHLFGHADRPGRPPASFRIQKALSNLKDFA